jgi:hypothetical protein
VDEAESRWAYEGDWGLDDGVGGAWGEATGAGRGGGGGGGI